jgi:hypothetical protein
MFQIQSCRGNKFEYDYLHTHVVWRGLKEEEKEGERMEAWVGGVCP